MNTFRAPNRSALTPGPTATCDREENVPESQPDIGAFSGLSAFDDLP